MAIICPETNKPVVYLVCLECENKKDCNKGHYHYERKETKRTDKQK